MPWVGADGKGLGGTKMVRALGMCCVSQDIRGLRRTYAQSIIGATLKRRDGSGRGFAGVEADSRGMFYDAFAAIQGCFALRGLLQLAGEKQKQGCISLPRVPSVRS